MTKQAQIKDERGTTLIEFSVVITILLVLTFGMIDFGRYVYAISVVRAAAQEGARAGVDAEVDEATAETTAKDKMLALDLTKATVDVQKGPQIVEATVTYDFEFITPLGPTLSMFGPTTPGAFTTVTLTGTASMAIFPIADN